MTFKTENFRALILPKYPADIALYMANCRKIFTEQKWKVKMILKIANKLHEISPASSNT